MTRPVKLLALFLCAATLFACLPSSVFAATVKSSENPESISTLQITADFGEKVSKTEYVDGRMKITLAERYAEYENSYTGGNLGKIQIRARGNSTYSKEDVKSSGKYSYRIVLERNCNLFGLGSSDEWYLLANYYDATHLRNKIAYDFSASLGMYYTKSTWVRLVMNGKDMGLYQITQTLDIGKDKVDIPDWGDIAKEVAYSIAKGEKLSQRDADKLVEEMKADLSWVTSGYFSSYEIGDYYDTSRLDITSGYFIEYDNRYHNDSAKFRTELLEVPVQFDDPSNIQTNPTMLGYVQTLVNDFEEAVMSENGYNSKGKHYSYYVDVDSMVDYWIVFNLFKNIEFGIYSNFFYINEGKIYFGPCWDFDNGSNNQLTLRPEWTPADEWYDMDYRAPWWQNLYDDPYFVSKIRERWFEIAPAVNEMLGAIDLYYDVIEKDAKWDFRLFNADRENWKYPDSSCQSYDSEFNIFKKFMHDRVEWMNEQLSKRDPLIEDKGFEVNGNAKTVISSVSGRELEADKLTIFGCPSDYLLSSDASEVSIALVLGSAKSVDIFVNGIRRGTLNLSKSERKVTLSTEMLDMSENAVNVITLLGYNSAGKLILSDYKTVRVSSDKNPKDGQVIVKFGDTRYYISKGETIKAPEIGLEMDGITALSWVDPQGNTLDEGKKASFGRSTEFYINWQRDDPFTYPTSINGKPISAKDKDNEGQNSGITFENVSKDTFWILAVSGAAVAVLSVVVTIVIVVNKKKKRLAADERNK